jgi:hypothetical protein
MAGAFGGIMDRAKCLRQHLRNFVAPADAFMPCMQLQGILPGLSRSLTTSLWFDRQRACIARWSLPVVLGLIWFPITDQDVLT